MPRQFASRGLRVLLLDGYVDEPSCLGVPPYISPYVRYTMGALVEAGVEADRIEYMTIDLLRESWAENLSRMEEFELIVMVAGTTVPGRYLGGRPASLAEIRKVAKELAAGVELVVGGPLLLCAPELPQRVIQSDETCAFGIYEHLTGLEPADLAAGEKVECIARWSRAGAEVVRKHPRFPHVVCELETYRGCLRRGNCAFCSERYKRILYTRSPEDLRTEVAELYRCGVRNFRLGAQTDLFLYGAGSPDEGREYPRPEPEALAELYSGIRGVAPGLEVLHMDNASPGTIARYPEEAEAIIRTVVEYNTPGDTAAFGLESADPAVLEENGIGTTPEETLRAVEIMNEYGARREEGVPKLLPGLNFLHGLAGETKRTLELNLEFLRGILERGLLLRRINIRQVRALAGYEAERVDRQAFVNYKERVNREVNGPMLRRVFPRGTVLKRVFLEEVKGNLTYGRQFGTYPILVGVPGQLATGRYCAVRIVDYGYRSVTGLPVPFAINGAGVEQLAALPGVGKNRALRIFLELPINTVAELEAALDEDFDVDEILPYIDSLPENDRAR